MARLRNGEIKRLVVVDEYPEDTTGMVWTRQTCKALDTARKRSKPGKTSRKRGVKGTLNGTNETGKTDLLSYEWVTDRKEKR